MGKKFAEYSKLDLSEVNGKVLKKWDENQVFAKSMTEREGCPSFVFFEGPPSANGMPGIHHVMARSIKDIFCRYKTMKGFQVKRKAGWDTHGLPVELGVEKALGITKEDIGKTISVAEYNAACRKDVMKFTKEWEDLTHKMGYWVDMQNPYITYDNRYIETLWWLLKQLHKKGLLYKGYTIQPYSPAAGTGLSSHELNQPGCYRDVKDTTVVGQFKMKNPKPEMAEWGTPYFLAWTTTPWTLPSNTALCVGPKIDYVAVQTYNGYTGEKMTVVLAKALLYTHFNKKAEELALEDYKPGDKLIPFKIVGEYKGPDLAGMEYEQLIPWVKPVEVDNDGNWSVSDKGFRVILGDYVTTEDGTGIVHIAPTFGADDAFVARAAGIPSLFMINKRGETRPMVDLTGKFYLLDELDERFVKECVDVDAYKEYQGRWVKNAYDPQFTVDGKYDEKAAQAAETLDIYICMMMKAANQAFKIEKHQWFADTERFFTLCHRFLSDGGILAFSTFGKRNMQEIHTLTGHGLEYFSLEELKALLSSRFEVLYAEEEIVSLPFGTPLEVLQHLRQTGVTGTEKRVWTRGRLQSFCEEYIRMYGKDDRSVSLTYHPIYVIARKRGKTK